MCRCCSQQSQQRISQPGHGDRPRLLCPRARAGGTAVPFTLAERCCVSALQTLSVGTCSFCSVLGFNVRPLVSQTVYISAFTACAAPCTRHPGASGWRLGQCEVRGAVRPAVRCGFCPLEAMPSWRPHPRPGPCPSLCCPLWTSPCGQLPRALPPRGQAAPRSGQHVAGCGAAGRDRAGRRPGQACVPGWGTASTPAGACGQVHRGAGLHCRPPQPRPPPPPHPPLASVGMASSGS